MKNFAIKAKKAIKKVAAMSIGAAMVGSTLFGAATATDLSDYPNPFIEDGMWNTVLVVGTDAAASDVAGAIDISATLSQQATTVYTTTETTTTVSGGVNLASGDDKVYFGEELGDAGTTALTESEFPSILADNTFTDDLGTDYDYTQKIEIQGTTDYAEFTYGTSGNDLDDPALIIDLGSSKTDGIYNMVINFNEEANLSGSNAVGESIEFFGKQYTIGTESSNTDGIQLLGGSMDISLDWGETKTVTFQGEEYEISLGGIQDGGSNANEATITVSGDTETITQGRTKKVGGIDVYADTVNYYGLDAYPGDAIISLGADELWLKNGNEVMVGSDKEDIDNTNVAYSWSNDYEDVTEISISVSAGDDDYDHLLEGESFTDPVFGTIKTVFADAVNAPTISEGTGVDTNDARREIDVSAADSDTLQVELTDSEGNTETIEWAYDNVPATDNNNTVLADSNGNGFALYEGEALDEEGNTNSMPVYTALNSNGEYSGFVMIDSLDDSDASETDLDIKDVLSGDTVISWNSQDLTGNGKDFSYRGKTYTATAANDSGVTIVDSTTGSTNIYPYIELFSGYDHNVAFVDELTNFLSAVDSDGNDSSADTIHNHNYILPSGTMNVKVYDNTSNVTFAANATVGSSVTTLSAGANTVTVGQADYTVTCDAFGIGSDSTWTCNISFMNQYVPGMVIVEDEDNNDEKHVVYMYVDDDGGSNSDMTTETPQFTGTSSNGGLDDSDLRGYIDYFGTYAIRDTSGDQDVVTFTVPKQQMYADVYVAPLEATTTTTESGEGVTVHSVSGVDVAKLDTEVSDKTAKPMILVGGPCVNDLVDELASDGDFRYGCDNWPASNFGIIEIAENAFGGSKVAMVIAGTTADDTRRACKVLKDYSDYELSGDSMKVTGTQTTPVVEPYVEETEETEETETEGNTTE